MEVILLGVGMLIGCVITLIIFKKFQVGDLRVDNSIPEDGPYLFLELYRSPEDIMNKQYVVLKVNTQSYISHD